ncbi:DUF349 domain-containing protein [Tunicatimonas pelagia]|uniref:DUF349 domain-containing protein n=1 Tax=Tunicatimonas pelagia TaxID=931531 RepID=UPI002667187E|nr:DUF349 domain-containing protein [Tunicatimonas pelagia]WKN42838.1 DUF349 domain-containing protein [Tunicatimonas pelagia]
MDQATTPFGFIQDGKIYRNAFLEYPAREIGEVRESEASTIKYFEDRFTMAENKVAQLEQSVEESENKGSYLMKLIHMRESLAKFDALGEYTQLYERLDVIEEKLREIIAQNRIKNLEIKRALIAEAEPFEFSSDWQEATDQLKEVKGKWIKTGAVDEEYQEEIEGRFNEILDNFFQRRKKFFEERKQMMYDRMRRYREINNDLYQLLRAPDKQEARERAKELQAAWREVGKIPSFQYSKLFRNHKSLTNKIFRSDSYGGYQSRGGYDRGDGGYGRQGGYDQNRGGYDRSGGYSRPPRGDYGNRDYRGGDRHPGDRHSGDRYSSDRRGGDRYGNSRYGGQSSYMSPEEAMSRKKELISKAQDLIGKEEDNMFEKVKQLRMDWKQSGRISRERSIELTETFNYACEKALEINFLERLVANRNPDYLYLNTAEQLQQKIPLLSNLISRDEEELARSKAENQHLLNSQDTRNFSEDDRRAAGRLRSQMRKLQVKKELLDELQSNLDKYL